MDDRPYHTAVEEEGDTEAPEQYLEPVAWESDSVEHMVAEVAVQHVELLYYPQFDPQECS